MILSKGNNEFTNNTYSYWEWSAPILQTYDEILSKVKELKLEGRTIKNIYCVGMAYNWTDDNIANCVYNAVDGMSNNQRQSLKNPRAFLPEGVYLLRWAEIDEPLLIEFEDGDVLAIDYSEGSSVRIDINTVPKNISFGTNRPTVNADKLFNDIIGKEIVALDITTSTESPDFTASYGLTLDEQASYIIGFSIRYRSTDSYYPHNSLFFTSHYDYGVVELKDCNNETLKVHAPDIKQIVEGFIEDEILDSQEEFDDWDK